MLLAQWKPFSLTITYSQAVFFCRVRERVRTIVSTSKWLFFLSPFSLSLDFVECALASKQSNVGSIVNQ